MLELSITACILGASYLAWKAGREHRCDKCYREGVERGVILGAALEGKVNVVKHETTMGPSSPSSAEG